MKSVLTLLGVILLGAGLAACSTNDSGYYKSGDYYNSFGQDHYQPYEGDHHLHWHNSYR
jgi:hypothetical protein